MSGVEGGFASIADLQHAHFTLLRIASALERRDALLRRPAGAMAESIREAVADPAAFQEKSRIRRLRDLRRARRLRDATARLWQRARRLERRTAATGRTLGDTNDRAFAQSVVDFWSLRQPHLMRSARELAERIRLEERDLEGRDAPPRRRLRRDERALPVRRALAAFDPATAPEFADDQSPFVGLSMFMDGAAAGALFQSRRDNVAELRQLVTAKRLVIVHGLPGSGDGSLVITGLLPALRDAPPPPDGRWTLWPPMVPGADAVAALLQSVRSPAEAPARWVAANRPLVNDTPARFAEVAARAGAGEAPSVLVVDQAEELTAVTVDSNGMRRVSEAIAALVTTPTPAHRVVLIVRASYAERLLTSKPFADVPKDAIGGFHPRPLCSEELALAIEQPARTIGLRIEPEVIKGLVRAVSNDPAALPLLEVALAELWSQRERNVIPLAAFEAMGSPNDALARLAEATFLRVEQHHHAIVQKLFQVLVVPLVGDDYVRRRVRREALQRLAAPADVDAVLDAFVGAGLLRRTDGIELGDDRFDVRHEALIRVWRRLAEWLSDERRANERRLAVLSRARSWRDSGEAQDQLAIGKALAEAEEVANDDPLIDAYVAASKAAATSRVRQRRYVQTAGALLAVVLAIGAWLAVLLYQQSNASAESAEAAKRNEVQVTEDIDTLLNQSDEIQAPAAAPETSLVDGLGQRGVIWIGSGRTPLLREVEGTTLITHLNVRVGGTYRLRAPIKLRVSEPKPGIPLPAIVAGVPAGRLVVAMRPPIPNPRPSGTQYFLPVRLVPRVFLQSPPGAQAGAKRLIDVMRDAGFETLPYELLASARGQSEVRYIFAQDEEPAKALAEILTRHLRARDPSRATVRTVFLPKLQGAARAGVIEAWIDPSDDPG